MNNALDPTDHLPDDAFTDPNTKLLELTRGLYAAVDVGDYALLVDGSKWCAWTTKRSRTFYAVRNVRRPDAYWTKEQLHRVLLAPGAGVQIDHVNGYGLDNRRANLRAATNQENHRNQALRSNNSTGYIGVCWHKQSGRFLSQVKTSGRAKHVGLFFSADAAAVARDDYVRENWGSEYSTFNFPRAGERGLTDYRTAKKAWEVD